MSIFSRKNLRLKNYDYSSYGYYFVTMCVKNRQSLLGDIVDGQMQLNECGQIVNQSWQWLEKRYLYIKLDEYIIMPNHMHGIIVIRDGCSGGSRTATTHKIKSLGRLIGAFKTISTKQINQICSTPGEPLWQRNFYERVLRNEDELLETRKYIQENPLKWDLDPENA